MSVILEIVWTFIGLFLDPQWDCELVHKTRHEWTECREGTSLCVERFSVSIAIPYCTKYEYNGDQWTAIGIYMDPAPLPFWFD